MVSATISYLFFKRTISLSILAVGSPWENLKSVFLNIKYNESAILETAFNKY